MCCPQSRSEEIEAIREKGIWGGAPTPLSLTTDWPMDLDTSYSSRSVSSDLVAGLRHRGRAVLCGLSPTAPQTSRIAMRAKAEGQTLAK